MVSKKTKEKWETVVRLLNSTHEKSGASGEDERLVAYQEEAKDLADADVDQFLDDVVEVLSAQEMKLKKRRLERLSRIDDDENDDDDSPVSSKKAASKLQLEDKTSALKRTTAARYLEACGGKSAGYKASKGLVEFLSCTSLPSGYDTRLTRLANESHVAMKAVGLLKSGKTATQSDLQALGEIVLAETAAKAFVLYAAWHREVVENHRWGDGNALQLNIDATVKTTLALALKDATGEDIKKPSLGDIFTPSGASQKDPAPTKPHSDFRSSDSKCLLG